MVCNIEEVKAEDLKVSSGFRLYEFVMPLLSLGARTQGQRGCFSLTVLVRFFHPKLNHLFNKAVTSAPV